MPVITASDRYRKLWACERAASPVIHRESRSRVAILPSRDIAHLAVTNGEPVFRSLANPSTNSSARRCAVSSTSRTTSIPAAVNSSKPRPATSGFGSTVGQTTLLIPASIIARLHGGVVAKC